VMIALVEDGVPVVGVVWEPALGRWTSAVAGAGCFTETQARCRVTATSALEKATLVQSHSRPDKPSQQALALAPAKVIETHSAGAGRQAGAGGARRGGPVRQPLPEVQRLGHRRRARTGDGGRGQGDGDEGGADRVRPRRRRSEGGIIGVQRGAARGGGGAAARG